MTRIISFASLAILVCSPTLWADYQWKKGLSLVYQEEQSTKVKETLSGSSRSSGNYLKLTKVWTVTEVDSKGIATLQLSLRSLRMETTPSSGEKLVFDSDQLDKSNPQLREQLKQYIGKTLAIIQLDAKGKIVKVKQSDHGPKSRFESEHPFVCVWGEQKPKAGATWKRKYQVTLEPPAGTGEKYNAEQTFTCASLAEGKAKISFTTKVLNLPRAQLDQIPLIQLRPQGEVVFDVKNGKMLEARHTVKTSVSGHQGKGSIYNYESSYKAKLIESWLVKGSLE